MAKNKVEELLEKGLKSTSKGKVRNLDQLVSFASDSASTAEQSDFYKYINLMVDKIVQQELFGPSITTIYDKWKMFGTETLVGSAKSFVNTPLNQTLHEDLTGTAQYLPSKKNADGTYSVARFDGCMIEQISEPISKLQTDYTQSMIQVIGKVTTKEKIIQLVALMVQNYYKTLKLFLFDSVFDKIVNYFTSADYHGLTINDTESQNNYQCAMKLNLLTKTMDYITSEYVLDPQHKNEKGEDAQFSLVKTATPLTDLIVLVHPEVLIKWKMGTKAGIFNPQLTAFLEGIPTENIIALPTSKYKNGLDVETPEIEKTPYVDTNTIIVINKEAFKILIQNNKSGSQYYAANDTQYLCQHFWYSLNILGFSTGFIYKCANLNKSITDQASE